MNTEMQKTECGELSDAELTEKELNNVTGGTTGHDREVSGRHDPRERNTV